MTTGWPPGASGSDGDRVPIAPPVVGLCDGEFAFTGLPAGHRIVLQVTASRGATALLFGRSNVLTIPANTALSAAVALGPITAPVATAVLPDPVPPDTFAVLLLGSALGDGRGDSSVALGGASAKATL